ncbi:pyruvate formate lyase-activating protein [Alphaproteobacteria bacterium]|nr:pyruvate formate lyase-activating protein [Alphaproteobacteria bacterium]
MHGAIFDIQHFSLHDGPGVRSTVFFKGCPLSCRWCSNPESQRPFPELLFFKNNCVTCGLCVETCKDGALFMDETGVSIRRDLCSGCGACVSICPERARVLSGKMMSVKEVSDEVRQHWRIFMQSGGGVTCSGGEVLSQPVFLKALLENLHDALGLHICLDTSGYAPWEVLEPLLKHTDMVLLDIKHMDDEKHKKGAGQGNETILENARKLGRRLFPTLVRLPLIPGFNDDEKNIHALGAFMKESNLGAIEILPYHEFGVSKHEALGKTYRVHTTERPQTDRAEAILNAYGLEVERVRNHPP